MGRKEYKRLKPHLRKLSVKLGQQGTHGSNIDVYQCDELEKIYNRKNLCLKVYHHSKSIWGFDGASASSPIYDSTIAQNLLAMKGISPRVYDLVEIDGKTAQVTDFLTGSKKGVTVNDKRFEYWYSAWENKLSYVNGMAVDYQGTRLIDHEGYKKWLVEETNRRNNENGYGKRMYQSTDYFAGIRDTNKREETYGFKDFEGKSVLDIGCSNGMMCRKAYDLGAKRVVGIEIPNMAESAQELAIMDGYFNLDFIGADVKTLKQKDILKLTGIKRFDIHLFLAMENHVGWHDWVKNCDTLYYESHDQPRKWKVIDSKKGVIREGIYRD